MCFEKIIWFIVLILSAVSAHSAQGNDCEGLYKNYTAAVWPKDIANTAKSYLDSCQDKDGEVAGVMSKVVATSEILRDIPMGRTTYLGVSLPVEESMKRRNASLGDAEAAYQVALSLTEDSKPQLWWMQFSAKLGNGKAAYSLALYYRKNGQPNESSIWESQARALGYSPGNALGNKR